MKTPRIVPLFVFAAAVLLLGLPAWGSNLARRPHMDLQVGFSFQPPSGWRGVPPSARYLGEGFITAGGSQAKCERVCEYRRPGSDGKAYLRLYYLGGARGDLHRALSILQSGLSDAYGSPSFGEARPARVGRSRGLAFTAEASGGRRLRCTVLVSKKRGLGLVACSDDETARSAVQAMEASVRTASLVPKGRLGGLRARWGRTVRLSDWNVLRTKYYDIEHNTDEAFVEELGRRMTAIQKLYRTIFPSDHRDRFRIKVFARSEGFHRYSGTPEGVVAYFSPGQGELCCYRTRDLKTLTVDGGEVVRVGKEMAEEEVFRVMFHEGWHQYLQSYVGRHRFVGAPMWFNEGMAEYFFGGRFDASGRFEVGLHRWRASYITKLIETGRHVPLSSFLTYDRNAYYSKPGVCYAQGWSLCYFLLRSGSKEYRALPAKMLFWLKRCGDGARAMEKVFASIDIAKLEKEWMAFQLSLELPKETVGKR